MKKFDQDPGVQPRKQQLRLETRGSGSGQQGADGGASSSCIVGGHGLDVFSALQKCQWMALLP